MKEQDLVNAIIDWFHLHGAWAIRINSGAMPVEGGSGRRFIRMAPPGTPDILAIWPGGLGVAVECKVGKNKPTDAQNATLQQISDCGGLSIVAYSVDDLENSILGRTSNP